MFAGTFHRSLAFAAVAGLGTLVALPIAAPAFGLEHAARLYLLAAGGAYAVAIAPRDVDRSRLLLGVALAGAALAWLAPSVHALLAAILVGLAGVRSGYLYSHRGARGLLLEGALVGASLGLASLVGLGAGRITTVDLAVITWAVFLVQSTYFLFGGRRTRPRVEGGADPFELALARANELLASDSRLGRDR